MCIRDRAMRPFGPSRSRSTAVSEDGVRLGPGHSVVRVTRSPHARRTIRLPFVAEPAHLQTDRRRAIASLVDAGKALDAVSRPHAGAIRSHVLERAVADRMRRVTEQEETEKNKNRE